MEFIILDAETLENGHFDSSGDWILKEFGNSNFSYDSKFNEDEI